MRFRSLIVGTHPEEVLTEKTKQRAKHDRLKEIIGLTPPANGIEIAFEIFGDPAGPPLLLINGLGGQMINRHEDFCTQFVNRGFRVIRFDNRDVGLSSMFDHDGVPDVGEITRAQQQGRTFPAPYTLWDMAADALG